MLCRRPSTIFSAAVCAAAQYEAICASAHIVSVAIFIYLREQIKIATYFYTERERSERSVLFLDFFLKSKNHRNIAKQYCLVTEIAPLFPFS